MQTTIESRIAECVRLRPASSQPQPQHDSLDRHKVDQLKSDMRQRGWQGPPVVVDGELAVTGTHRLKARAELANEGYDLDLPEVELSEVCAQAGIDWPAHCDEHLNWDEAVRTIEAMLPRAVVDYLGLDAH